MKVSIEAVDISPAPNTIVLRQPIKPYRQLDRRPETDDIYNCNNKFRNNHKNNVKNNLISTII